MYPILLSSIFVSIVGTLTSSLSISISIYFDVDGRYTVTLTLVPLSPFIFATTELKSSPVTSSSSTLYIISLALTPALSPGAPSNTLTAVITPVSLFWLTTTPIPQ